MLLIPQPKKKATKKGAFDFSTRGTSIVIAHQSEGARFAAEKLQQLVSRITGKEIPVVAGDRAAPNSIVLVASSPESVSESYELDVGCLRVTVKAEGPAGLFRGAVTLGQILAMQGPRVPCCTIADSPDFAHRGFLHDVTRGKVPTLATMKLIVDKLAYYKMNQLQLYVEHTFAFRQIPELWHGRDPLTAEEIVELDRYCRRNFVELVPCLATFGHLYELLRIERFEHLNELNVKASRLPHSLWDRMAHYTIDACSEEAFLLIKSMLDEYLPLFSSPHCNICCDETFDLGRGKNRMYAAVTGVGRLYADFVKKLAAVVRSHGKTTMLWGDIVLKHHKLIGEMPADAVFLNWAYGPRVTERATKIFANAKVRQYVCPGVSGWSRFANELNAATSNIRRMAGHGYKNGAEGVLVTDWGDCGHVNMLANSFHGLALGAALSWNAGSYPDDRDFDRAMSALEWGERSGTLVSLQRKLGALSFYHFCNMYAWVNGEKGLWDREREVRLCGPGGLEKKYRRARRIYESFLAMKTSGAFSWTEQDCGEFVWSARAVRWTLSLLAFKKRNEYRQMKCPPLYVNRRQLIYEGKQVVRQFEELWRKRNKESELRNVTATFEKMFVKIAGIKEIHEGQQ